MSRSSIYRWDGDEFVALDYCDMTDTTIEAADSWLVVDGVARGLELHKDRFVGSSGAGPALRDVFDAGVAIIPREGSWFPRIETQNTLGALRHILRLRDAPPNSTHLAVTTWPGEDPRTEPWRKGPDLDAMIRLRTTVQARGAGEAVIVNEDGYVVESSQSGLLWWRGDILCGPPADFPRVRSITVLTMLTLARALGIETYEEAVTPAELADTEVWALNALHGARIVTEWIDGPPVAQLPGRLAVWRARLDALRKPLP